MINQMKQYMSEIAANMEKEGDALKEYSSFLSRLREDLHFCKLRLKDREDYDNGKERPDFSPLTDEEVEEHTVFLEQASGLISKIEEIIADEINHSVILSACMVEYGCIAPTSDGIAEAVLKISQGGKHDNDSE